MRKGSEARTTSETSVQVTVNLEGTGITNIKTGIGFFDHMLILLGAHGGFDLDIMAEGDLVIDGHHTVEDTGIVLGKAFANALGDKKGINRYGTVFIPMDEALAMVSLDISGRPYLYLEMPELAPVIGDFDTELLEEFFRAFAVHSGTTLHIKVFHGKNSHHITEAVFKALGRALGQAVAKTPGNNSIPSTKGYLE